jgi:hypothetical protein
LLIFSKATIIVTASKKKNCIFCVQNSNGGKTVPLKEGSENKVKVEVTAENGATKVHVHRLSAKDATLSNLTTSISEVVPSFSSDKLEYFCKFVVIVVYFSLSTG